MLQISWLAADAEYLGTALRAYTLSRWFTVLHGDLFRALNLGFLPALHAICCHLTPPLFNRNDIRLRFGLSNVRS